jgi:ribosome-associated protein
LQIAEISIVKRTHLNNLTLLEKRKKSTIARITRNSKLFKTIIHAMQEKKAERIVSLDLKKIPEAVTDFFIICEANNPIQLKAIGDFVEEEVKKKCGESPYKHEGRQGEQWILIDYVNIVVHIMLPEPRKFYKLEEMWNDASVAEH